MGTGIGYGLNGGLFLTDHFGVGAFIRGGNHDRGITSFFYGAEALARFAAVMPGLHFGASIGSGKFSAGGFSGSSSFTWGVKAA